MTYGGSPRLLAEKEHFFGLSFGDQRWADSATMVMSPTATFTEDDMMERLLALLLAGALVASQVELASESELHGRGVGQATTASGFAENLPLPPIPYLDTMPWMNFGSESKGPRVDTLLTPNFVVPAIPKNSAFTNNDALNTTQLLAGTAVK
jgi:hypothetical protein